MKKIITVATAGIGKMQAQGLTVGLDLGDRSSCYCVLNEHGEIVLEQKVATTPKAMRERFADMPRCRMALETGTHSPWVSRLLSELGHEVIVAHAQKVQTDQQESAEERPHGCANPGSAGQDRSRAAVSHHAS